MKNKIVIIDSGVSTEYYKQKTINVSMAKNFSNSNDDKDFSDSLGHGTAITHMINTINHNADFCIIKIYDKELIADEQVLISALKYVLSCNFECSIIHMSLGISYYDEELFDVCKKIYDKGNIIVSAFDNSGSISYPAAFDFVVGVEANDSCTKRTDFFIPENDIVDVYSKGGVHRVAWLEGKYAIRQGNSISAAYVTGYLSLKKDMCFDKNTAINILSEISTYKSLDYINGFEKKELFDDNCYKKMNDVALFPFNKEIMGITNFSDMLTFKIEGVYTSKYLGNIGSKIRNFSRTYEYEINNIDNLNYSKIDTMIIGHLTVLENFTKTNIKTPILEKCLENGVNVYSLDSFNIDEQCYYKFKHKGLFLEVPNIKVHGINKNKKGKLYKIKTPVLGVFGTSSKQGKFTLQLRLRKLFLKNGYSISQVSSEPTGCLFGIDKTIPFGFNSNNTLNDFEFISYLNTVMNELDKKNTDIIIVGSQSRTIAESYNHLGHLAIKQTEFLMGTMPDAVILCVNPRDKIQYIHRTIKTIENLVSAKVIALAIYPFVFNNGWNMINDKTTQLNCLQIEKLKRNYENIFNIPSFAVNNSEDVEYAFDKIISFFQSEE